MFFQKCLNTLLKQNKFQKLRLEFHQKSLFCLYLAILSNYLTWCISITLLSSDIEINLGPKSSSREYLSIFHWNLNNISSNWDPCKGEQPLEGMGLKEKKIAKRQGVCQKCSISAGRHKLGISEFWSRGVWGPAVKAPNGIRGKSPEHI